jgi:hypothetical protein
MKTRRIAISLASLVLFLLLLASLTQAQGPAGGKAQEAPTTVDALQYPAPAAESNAPPAQPKELPAGAGVAALISDAIPFQGRLTTAGGDPLEGNHSITLALYDVEAGGVAQCSTTRTISITNGLFMSSLTGCNASVLDGKQLYLGVKVGADSEMTPRQPVYAVPYAQSLRPGAIINQSSATARGLSVQSTGAGSAGAALWAQNASTAGGIGIWSTVVGTDAAIVSSNNGTGALFKGFGADGGSDEFRINNDGGVETKADSFLWIPGNAFIRDLSSDSTRWDIAINGSALIYRGAVAGNKTIHFPVTLPSIWYGRAVKIEEVVIFYKTSNSLNAYITDTRMYRFASASTYTTIFADSTDRTSAEDASYTIPVTVNNVMSDTRPGVGLYLNLSFVNDTDYVQIGGIRIRLGHHSLN